jgi:hypothetical protein
LTWDEGVQDEDGEGSPCWIEAVVLAMPEVVVVAVLVWESDDTEAVVGVGRGGVELG